MKKTVTSMICAGLLAANCLTALAQEQLPAKKRSPIPGQDVVFETRTDPGGATFTYVATEGAFGNKIVKGAPYSAQAVTEEVQTLSDGNRIIRKNSSAVYRDSEGRTRQEQTLRSMGPYAIAGEAPQTVSIFDPVDGAHYMLDVNNKTARKINIVKFDMKVDTVDIKGSEGAAIRRVPDGETVVVTGKMTEARAPEERERVVRAKAELAAAQGAGGTFVVSSDGNSGGATFARVTKADNVKTESLGTQNVEGVSAEGTRTTLTIPAGEIGNEQPINVVTESWYSPELQVVVMKKHTDPRQGESTYRLTNINRAEPARSLFELPADYTLKETIDPIHKIRVEGELNRARKIKEQEEKEM